jgi:hypothetical protein
MRPFSSVPSVRVYSYKRLYAPTYSHMVAFYVSGTRFSVQQDFVPRDAVAISSPDLPDIDITAGPLCNHPPGVRAHEIPSLLCHSLPILIRALIRASLISILSARTHSFFLVVNFPRLPRCY